MNIQSLDSCRNPLKAEETLISVHPIESLSLTATRFALFVSVDNKRELRLQPFSPPFDNLSRLILGTQTTLKSLHRRRLNTC